MFKFLKDKIKGAIDKITKRVEEAPDKEVEAETTISEPIQEVKEEIKEQHKLERKGKEKKPKKEKEKRHKETKEETEEEPKVEQELKIEEPKPEIPEVIEGKKEEKHKFFDFLKRKKEPIEEIILSKDESGEIQEVKEKRGVFQVIKEKVTTKVISEKQFDELFWELEIGLLENNVAVEVIEKIKKDLKKDLTTKPIKRDKVREEVRESLKKSIESLFEVEQIDLIKKIKEKKEKPYIIAFFGVNGVGKTTTISKFAKLCQKNKLTVVLGAGDSFRKGAIEQIEELGDRLGVKVIRQQYGSDSTAICYDTVKYGKSHNIDVVLLDTAGRQHSNVNLMDELKKINKVINPDFKVFITESIVGNDAIEQSGIFNERIGIDGIILTKTDVDEKGGAIISIEYVTKKPIIYLGFGQGLDDLKEFNYKEVLSNLGL